MAKEHVKKCSPSLTIKKMQIKTTLRFHLTPVRIAIIRWHQQQVLARMWGKRNPFTLLVGMQTSTTTLKKIWRLLKNLNIDPPYDPAIHSWGYTQRNWTQVTPEALAHPCLLQHYSQ
jgi:hypothetical protein